MTDDNPMADGNPMAPLRQLRDRDLASADPHPGDHRRRLYSMTDESAGERSTSTQQRATYDE